MSQKNDWWTSPTENEADGRTIIVTGRRDVDKFRDKGRYTIRVDLSYDYSDTECADGFPDDATARTLEEVTDAFHAALKGKNAAIMTGIYTGAGMRTWVFYTFSTEVFTSFLNRALADLPLLPLRIYAENDPTWAESCEMKEISEIEAPDADE